MKEMFEAELLDVVNYNFNDPEQRNWLEKKDIKSENTAERIFIFELCSSFVFPSADCSLSQ